MPRMINQDVGTASRRRPGPSGQAGGGGGATGRRTPPAPQMTGRHPRSGGMLVANGTSTGTGMMMMAAGTANGGGAGRARPASGGSDYDLGRGGGGGTMMGGGGGNAAAAGMVGPPVAVHPREQQHQSNLMVQNAVHQYQHTTSSQEQQYQQQYQQQQQQQHLHHDGRSQGPPSVVEVAGREGGSDDGCYDNMEFTQLTQDSTFALLGMVDDNSQASGATSGNEDQEQQETAQKAQSQDRGQKTDAPSGSSGSHSMHEGDQMVTAAKNANATNSRASNMRNDDESSATMATNNNSQDHDKGKGKGYGDIEEDDEEEDDDQSMDLLAPSPPNKKCAHQKKSNHTCTSDGREVATPMAKGSKEGKKSAAGQSSTAMEAPGSASSQSTAISPATQTLNALSQMDAIGGGDLMMMYDKSTGGNDDEGDTTDDDDATCNDDAPPDSSRMKSGSGTGSGNAKAQAKGSGSADKAKSAKKKAPASSTLPSAKETNSLTPMKTKKMATPKQTKKKAPGPAKSAGKGAGWISSTSAFAKGNSGTHGSGDRKKKKSQQATLTNSTKKRSKPHGGGITSRTDYGTHIDLLVTLSEAGKLGFRVKPTTGIRPDIESMLSKIPANDRPCVITAVKEGSQADRAGLKAKDALFHVNEDEPGRLGRHATVADAEEWAQQGASRPIIFIARRFNTETRNERALSRVGVDESLATHTKADDCADSGTSKGKDVNDNEPKMPASNARNVNDDVIGQILSSPESSKEEEKGYTFQGKTYKTYSDMVKAKRARNAGVLQDIGLVDAVAAVREGAAAQNAAKGGKKRKAKSKDDNSANQTRRKSSRFEKNDEDSGEDEEGGLLPDCHGCKEELADVDRGSGSPLQHHVLCPERSDYVSSGARAQLRQIRRTLKRCDCPACKWYLKHRNEGAKNGRAHNPLCEKSKLFNANASGKAKVSTRSLAVTFCKRCNGEGGGSTPLEHHVFCHLHPDFERFGAKAKLGRIQRNATENGCEACSFRLENGRPDKTLSHGSKCDYNTEEKATEDTSEDITAGTRSSAAVTESRESIIERLRREGAKGDCTRCKEELRAGKKAVGNHKEDCPLRNDQGLRRIGATSGCQKCANELRTEKKDKTFHGKLCPLSKHYGTKGTSRQDVIRRSADAGCQKCADEIRTGAKQLKQTHSKNCPLSRNYKNKTKLVDPSTTTAAEILLDIRDSPNKKLPASKKTVDTAVPLSFHPISETNKEEPGTSLLPNSSANGVAKVRITPSPKPQHAPSEGVELKAATYLEPMEESDFEDNESSTLWEQCGNPWGDIGVAEEDHVIITPCSGLNPDEVAIASLALPRFNTNPFDENSTYRQSHQKPEVGVRVLKLKRDVMAMQPWGLSVKRHEFGGACLVSSVDPISPAVAAEDIGGGRNARGLRVNDMVLLVNNKSVGGMTEDDLEVEFEISGEELILVVSQYNGGPMKGQSHEDENEEVAETWLELDKGAFDWQEMGPGSRAIVPSASSRLSKSNLDSKLPPMPSSGETAPDVSQLRRETFRVQANHDDHPLLVAYPHKDMTASSGAEERKQSVVSKSTRLFTSHTTTNEAASTAKTPEQQIEVQNHSASAHDADVFRGGEENTRRAQGQGSDIDKDGDTVLGGSQEDGADLANDGDDAPGLSLNRVMADFALPKKKRGNEEEEEDSAKRPLSVEKGTPCNSSTDVRAREVIADWNAEGGDGDDPELGCICGAIHAEPEPVFWLHCDTCQSWYNNSVRCIGFDQEAANKMEEWTCPSCGGEPAIPHEGTKKFAQSDEENDDLDNTLPIGSRLNVVVGKDLWKGTIQKVGRTHGDVYYRVNFDGNRKATLTTVFSYQIHSIIVETEGERKEREKEREKEIDRNNIPCNDTIAGTKRPSGVAFRNDFDDESEESPPKKKPAANATLTAAADEDSDEDEFVITESEALFLSGNGNIGNPHQLQTNLGTNVGEQRMANCDGSQLAEMPTISGGEVPLEPTTGSPNTKTEEQKKPKPAKKPVFETLEEVDEGLIEFKDCGKIERRRIDWDHTPISVGSLVRVADRSAGTNGGNKLGGVAKVMGHRGSRSENNLVYDLRYVIGGNREFDVSWRYVVLNSDFDSTGGDDDGGGNGRGGSRRYRISKRPTVLDM